MTDKELLELAAKAAGIEVEWKEWVTSRTAEYQTIKHTKRYGLWSDGRVWNPLTDDGDALRLAVKLGIKDYFSVEVQTTCVQATAVELWEHCEYEEYKTQDPYAATRRAIVRAAAEIGATCEK